MLVITGLSGSGKTHVSRALEDLGWYCVDNLPDGADPAFTELLAAHRAAAARRWSWTCASGASSRRSREVYRGLSAAGSKTSLLFLEADERGRCSGASARRAGPIRSPVNEPVIEGDQRGALALRAGPEDRGPDPGHLELHRPRAARLGARALRRSRGSAPDGGLGDLVRLQVRAAVRRRPGLRRALPAEPEFRARG